MNKTGIEHMAAALRATIFAAALFVVPAVVAQNALPKTPPELKDFKLDPEKKPAEPKPEVKTPVIVPPEVKPVKAAPTAIAAPAKRAPEPARKTATPQAEKTASVKATPPPEQAADVPSPAPALVPVVVPPAQALPDSQPEPGFGLNKLNAWTIPAGVALAALALLALGFALWRRRGRKSSEIYEEPETATVAPEFATNSVHEETQPPVETPIVTAPPTPPVASPNRPELDISFIPAKATVSIANLTINGQLRIVNHGKAAANSMALRSILISASETQNEVIAAFHGDKAAHFVEELGEAGPGERIAMDIELSIPLTELRSFALGDQRLLVPIFLADVEYTWGKKGRDAARLCCMIGREATPPKPKLGPLRLDLGPRSYAPLGQRPVSG